MHSEEDRQNLLKMGVSPERTLVVGSSKYDGLRLRAGPEAAARWREIFRIPENIPVVLGGSLRRSECTGLLEVFYRIQKDKGSCLGIFAPRHLHHIPAMAEWLDGHGVPFQMLSDIERERRTRNAPVVLVDRIGILFELYAVGDLIFCGGTLEPIGGHNILEPAAWSKPAFYGPHVEKVSEEHKVLTERQGSFLVRDFDDLFQQWAHLVATSSRVEDLRGKCRRSPELSLRGRGKAAEPAAPNPFRIQPEDSMTPDRLRSLLQEFKDGKMNLEEVLDFLKKLPYEDLAFARVDHHRGLRRRRRRLYRHRPA